jgi:hypothetical protein
MEHKRTTNNYILIKLDPENKSIKLSSGMELYIDQSFDPEKHATVTGVVWGVPERLLWAGKPNVGLPWKTNLEVKVGDKVIMYYLSIINALKREVFL